MKSLTRQQLYELVWSMPMSKLAEEFHLSDVGLKKVCKKHQIPAPYRGYWARKEAGQNPRNLSLLRLAAGEAHLETIHFHRDITARPPEPVRQVIAAQKRNREAAPSATRKLPPFEPISRPHSILAKTASTLRRAKATEGGVSAKGEGDCGVWVAEISVERALAFLDAVIRALLEKKWSVSAVGVGVEVTNGEDIFVFTVKERSRLVPHRPTEEELELERRERQQARARDQFYSLLYSRPYPEKDRIWTGEFAVEIVEYGISVRKSWADGRTQSVEGLLPVIIDGMEVVFAAQKQVRLQKAERERQWREAERRRALTAARSERENRRTKLMSELAAIAVEINQLEAWLTRVDGLAGSEEFRRMFAWAKERRDSLVARLAPTGLTDLLRERNLFPAPEVDPLREQEAVTASEAIEK